LSLPNRTLYHHEALSRYARHLGTQEIHTLIRPELDLHAIVAIHSTKRGPAIGGCRLHPYATSGSAVKDVLRLSFGMTLKAAASELPHGGAKAVICMPRNGFRDREAAFAAFGDFVHSLNGRYITAMDMGTTTADMDVIAERTPHVIGAAGQDSLQGDPSPYTANGVFLGIKAAVKFKLDKDTLDSVNVSLQGAGKVASTLCKHLVNAGANVTICDTREENVQALVNTLGVKTVSVDELINVPCDVFSPCAVGATITTDFLQQTSATIIAGAANNQLSHAIVGKKCQELGILYAPDYVLNAGGLIHAASVHDYRDVEYGDHLIERIYDRMLTIFERSAKENITTNEVAKALAREHLDKTVEPVVEDVIL